MLNYRQQEEEFDRDEWSPGAHNIFRSNVIVAVVIFALHSWFFGYYVRHIDQAFLASWPWLFGSLTFYGVYAVAIFIGLCHWPFFAAITGTVGALIFSEAFQSAAMAVHSSPRAHEMMSLVIGTGFAILAGILVLYLGPASYVCKTRVVPGDRLGNSDWNQRTIKTGHRHRGAFTRITGACKKLRKEDQAGVWGNLSDG